jgi:hypothetical protein
VATHSPPQALKPPAQVKPQVVPLQVRVELAGPFAHAVQEEPQLLTSLSGRHCAPHAWKPALQLAPQVPLVHSGEPLLGAVHATQLAPHWVMLESATQVPLQLWKPTEHCQPQVVPSQVRTELAGPFGHGLQLRVPQELTLVSSEQAAPHLCVPVLQVKSQAMPLQVLLPLKGGAQAVQAVVPHEATERFDTHAPLQPCAPVLQLNPQANPSQVAVEFPGGMHAEQLVPHELVEVFETQAAPHR